MNLFHAHFIRHAVKNKVLDMYNWLGKYNIFLKNKSDDNRYYAMTEIDDHDNIKCIEFEKSGGFGILDKQLPGITIFNIKDIDTDDITEICKSGIQSFRSINFFILYEILPIAFLSHKIEEFLQWIYNKKAPREFLTDKVLEIITTNYLRKFDSMTIVRKLYSDRIFRHPDFSAIHTKIDIILSTLVASGDLTRSKSDYVTANAPITYGKIQTEERRHQENRRRNTILLILTGGLLFTTGVYPIYKDIKNEIKILQLDCKI